MFNWFLDLNSKIKLFVLSSTLLAMIIIVAAIGYFSNLRSITAANDISVIINRSSVRVNAVQMSLREFDNSIVAFLTDTASSSQSTEQFKAQLNTNLNNLMQDTNTMNPERIGDKQATPEYKQAILAIKSTMKQISDNINGRLLTEIETSRNAGATFYFKEVRPMISQVYNNCYKLIQEQNRTVVRLGLEGSDITMAYIGCVVAVIAVILGSIISWAICSYITTCIRRQSNFMREMCAGNFDFEIRAYNKDDFGSIIDSMRRLRDSMNKALSMVKLSSSRTESSLSRIVELSNGIADKVGDCEGKTINVSAASEQMLSTTQDIAKNCEDASNLSNATKDIIADGVNKIKGTIDEIRRHSEDMNANSIAVEKVAKRSLDINSIVNTIEEIAAQTNLLALNAAIEAARAGEAGRGFAVVADEVRALASRTAASTQEIADMVADIQKEAAAAAHSINDSVASMDVTSHNTTEVESTMHDMMEHINSVNMQITQIASAAEEQTAATNEISMHIHGITSLAQDANNQAQSTQSIISEAVQNLHELRDNLAYFKIASDHGSNDMSTILAQQGKA